MRWQSRIFSETTSQKETNHLCFFNFERMENYKQSIVNVIQEFLVQLGNDNPQLQDVIDRRYLGSMQQIDRIPMSVDNVSIASSRNTNDSEVRKYSTTIV